jgi:membrane protease YdiL (CAAX protease family)
MSAATKPLLVAIVTTIVVTALSYLLPETYAATGVGLGFLVATYLVVLRGSDTQTVRHYGLSLGGLLEPEPLDPLRMLKDSAKALGWALLLCAIFFPPFWLGYVYWWKPKLPFVSAPLPSLSDDVLGQLLVIALPEEAFYRGYLQRAFDDVWPPKRRILGAQLGLGILVASALFALGHLLTEVKPDRLAVFFPALVFGWLRARTGSIGAAVAFHAACNLFASWLAASYGFRG